ncbi:hypothetical protein TD95_003921 [Thielaviopsis punctulata]|uniref:Ubiquitin-like modifier HUB1 n=1 Tax=Thielaviopsis punctulata TaxID=72032 RepID=A0A0F4ZD90_9PEZI|nr:hypothetical protein TD95_003921 [Thielaviopsis punctulata]
MGGSPPPRNRSRSPSARDSKDRPRKSRPAGFAWKDKSRPSDDRADRSKHGLDRGYRRRDEESRRDRDRERDRDRYSERDRERDRDRRRERDYDRRDRNKDRAAEPRKKDFKAVPPPARPSGGGEEMIIVHVNDRLGTKAAIPCFASDRVKEFKILVAARIGREPHEILLKRQGERPFKDQLSLEDYGVSNGVQIDLEVDTGD